MRSVTHAVIDSLTQPAIPNGRFAMTKRKSGMPKATLNGPVLVKQPAAGRWKCDACGTGGYGGKQLLAHSAKSTHRVFSDVDYR